MKISYLPIFDKVLDVIHTANSSLDRDLVRQKVLNLYLETFDHEGAVFFLPDEAGNLSNTIINNLDETFNQRFKKYYCKFDPLQLIRKPQRTSRASMARSISYDSMVSTEYYNDFLRPQRIHYKLLAYLGTMEGILGKVALTRGAGSPCFSENEIRLARAVTPYLAHALYLNELQRKICLNDISSKRSDVLQNFNLSRRETEVAEHVFKGLKNSEIAKKLFVSEVTVKKHIQKIYTKLGVRNRTSMMNKIMEIQSAS